MNNQVNDTPPAPFSDVVVVGGGQAAARAALAVRDCNPDVAITIIGSEAHPPYERPQLSKSLLLDPGSPVPYVCGADVLAARNIGLKTGSTVMKIDREARTVSLEGGGSAPYDRLLLATGSRLKTLAIDGVAPDQIFYLRTLDQCRHLERMLSAAPAVAVIGGGFIGLEVAASASLRGCRVTVIEAADRLLPRLGCREASEMVTAYHRAHGIDIRLGIDILSGGSGRLNLSDGSQVEASVTIAGIGVVPETALAEAAGLEVNDGVVVDAHGQTSDPFIYAAGDVTRQFHPAVGRAIRLESWQNANDQAEAAGRSLAGYPAVSDQAPWLWSDQGDLNIQTAGAPGAVDRVITRGALTGADGATLFQIEGDRLVGGITLNRGSDMAVIRRLIGQEGLALPVADLSNPDIPLRKFAFSRRAA